MMCMLPVPRSSIRPTMSRGLLCCVCIRTHMMLASVATGGTRWRRWGRQQCRGGCEALLAACQLGGLFLSVRNICIHECAVELSMCQTESIHALHFDVIVRAACVDDCRYHT
jgi:hypothetical protein